MLLADLPPENLLPNSPHSPGLPADRLTDPEDQIRAGHSKSGVGIPSGMESNPRTMPSPSCSLVPLIRPTQSNSIARKTGNTPSGSGLTDDCRAKRSLRERAAVHSSPVAALSALFPLRSSTDGSCARSGPLEHYPALPTSEVWRAEGRTIERNAIIGERLGNSAASWQLLQLVPSNPSMLSVVGLDPVPVRCRNQNQNFNARLQRFQRARRVERSGLERSARLFDQPLHLPAQFPDVLFQGFSGLVIRRRRQRHRR